MADRNGRIKSLIAKNISDILVFELKNPHIGFPSVNEVRLSEDRSVAKVLVSFIGSKNPKKNLEELNRCKGAVRTSLAKKMDLRKCPDVLFIYDERFDKADSLQEALDRETETLENMKKGSQD